MINAATTRSLSFRSLATTTPVPPKPQPDPQPFQSAASEKLSFGLAKLKQRSIDEDPIELRTGGKFGAQLMPEEDEMPGRRNLAEQISEPPPEEEMGRHFDAVMEIPEEEPVPAPPGRFGHADFQPIFDEDDRRPQVTADATKVLGALQLANLVRQFSVR